MQSVHAQSRQWPLLLLMGALFLLAPFYYQDNFGGRGLDLTYNIPIWFFAGLLIFYGLFLFARQGRFFYPFHGWAFLILPVVLVLTGMLEGADQPIAWLFRQIYLLGGILFLFMLFQFRANQATVERVLLFVVISALLNAILATVQILNPEILEGLFVTAQNYPIGVFQQVNVLASFLATGLIVVIYLISRPSFQGRAWSVKALLVISTGMVSFIIITIGSRVGLLSGSIGILLITFSRWPQLKRQRGVMLLVFLAIAGGTYQGKVGFERISEKTAEIAVGAPASVRVNMYRIAAELVVEKPVVGHGIGSFLRVWGQQTGSYHQRYPAAVLPAYVTHPHNELVLWLIEGGLIAFLGILAIFWVVLLALWRCGANRAGAYFALLLPIGLHTLVEFPFYISSLHWFLWIFLIFMVLRHQTENKMVSLSKPAARLIPVLALLLSIGSGYFLVHTARAQADIMAFLQAKPGSGPYLNIARENLYFKTQAESLSMRSFLHHSIQTKQSEKVQAFVSWGEQRLALRPELKLHEDLINAYHFLNDNKNKCRIIHQGAWRYPANQPLGEAALGCK